MNPNERLLQLTRAALQGFTAGRTPLEWQQGMVRQVAWLSNFSAAYSWLNTTQKAARLNNQPLLGRCLPELLQQNGVPSVESTPTPTLAQTSSPSSPPKPPIPKYRLQQDKLAAAVADPQSYLPSPWQLSPQTDLQHLSVLAKDVVWDSPTRQIHTDRFAPPRHSFGAMPMAIDDQAWRQNLVERVRQGLSQQGLSQRRSSASRSTPPHILLAMAQKPATLAAQWDLPLTGQTVAHDQLIALVQPQSQQQDFRGDASRTVPTSQSNQLPDTSIAVPKSRNAAPQVMATDPSANPVFANLADANRALAQSVGSDRSASGVSGAAEREFWQNGAQHQTPNQNGAADVPIDPPTLQPLISELHSLHHQNSSEPFSASSDPSFSVSSTIRQAAQQPDDLSEIERNWLTANIKRILDEEARRYGIDV